MSACLALFAAFCAAALGGLALHARRPLDLHRAAERFGRAAARSVSDDWDALFI